MKYLFAFLFFFSPLLSFADYVPVQNWQFSGPGGATAQLAFSFVATSTAHISYFTTNTCITSGTPSMYWNVYTGDNATPTDRHLVGTSSIVSTWSTCPTTATTTFQFSTAFDVVPDVTVTFISTSTSAVYTDISNQNILLYPMYWYGVHHADTWESSLADGYGSMFTTLGFGTRPVGTVVSTTTKIVCTTFDIKCDVSNIFTQLFIPDGGFEGLVAGMDNFQGWDNVAPFSLLGDAVVVFADIYDNSATTTIDMTIPFMGSSITIFSTANTSTYCAVFTIHGTDFCTLLKTLIGYALWIHVYYIGLSIPFRLIIGF